MTESEDLDPVSAVDPVDVVDAAGRPRAAVPEDAMFSEDGLYVIGRAGKLYKKKMPVGSFGNLTPRVKGDPKMAGKRVVSEDRWNAYLETLREGGLRMKSAKAVGIDYSTVRARRKKDPAFYEAELEAEADACEVMEEALWELGKNKANFTAVAMWLNNRSRSRWQPMRNNEKQILEITGGITHTQEIGATSLEKISALMVTLEERKALIEGTIVDAEIVEG